MIAAVKSFFRPTNEIEHLRRVVATLCALLAVCVITLLVHGLQMYRSQTSIGLSDSDRLGMIILTDRASRR